MNTQGFALNFVFNAPQNGLEIKKTENNMGEGTSSFKDILSTKIDNTYSKSIKNNFESDPGSKTENISKPDPKYKSFREIAQANDNSKVSQSENQKKISNQEDNSVEDKKEQKTDASKAGNIVLQSLAGILGIKPEDLSKLLEKLNIKPEELGDVTKIESLVDKLATQLELSSDQKITLETVMKQIADAVSKSSEEPVDLQKSESLTVNNGKTQENAKVQVSKSGDTSGIDDKIKVLVDQSQNKDFSEVIKELRQNLDQLTEKLQQSPQKLMSQISDEVKNILGQASDSAKNDTVKNTTDVSSADESLKSADKTDKANDTGNADNKGNNQKDEKSKPEDNINNEPDKSTKTVELKQTVSEAVKHQDNSVKFDSLLQNQVQQVNDIKDITKIQKEIPVQKSEIINQVVEKAKVVLTGEKSEMVMDLKPDNLGKLSLKIVTERGMVVAKFVAESQQVKETLEANMQLLKDSLQKQGMSVQGFSVSVDQNPYRGFNMNNNSNSNSNSKRQADAGTIQMVNVAETPENSKVMNPYLWNESKINLTA